jgi:Trypsin-co-occurring domain 1
MSKLQPLLLDNGQIILVATTPNAIDTSALQQAEPPTPTAEEAMDLPEPTRTFIPPDEVTEAIDFPRSKDFKSVAQKVQQVMTTPIALPKLEAPKLDSEALKKAATQTVGDLVQGYTGYLLNSLQAVATTHVGISKVTLEFGVDLEFDTGIPYIASSAIGSSVKVTVECDLQQSSQS